MNQQEFIEKYKNKIVNALILVVALFIAVKIYNAQMRTVASLQEKKNSEMEKNKVLEDLGVLDKKVRKYTEFINNKDMSSVITILGELAKESSVEIKSIRPVGEETKPLYDRYPYELKLEADSYHNIGNFIARLESHSYIFLVDSAAILPIERHQENEPDKVTVDLRISTILLKK